MSEVKPTLVQADRTDETTPLNSWLSNFPSGRWIDAQSRNWYWIIINCVKTPSAYEYKIKFDVPAENTTLIFPFVVKTSDEGIKKVFIDGVKYEVRSKENYGDRFAVFGQEFSFKVATKYKLSKESVPIVRIENKQTVFKNVNVFSVPVIANCRDTSWQRFGGVWSSCDTWMPST
ncbi:hypothetical protein [Thermocrinis sp.]|jgi:hypothetical protein|uniref:hypothetical protein n=1 Tax=Thermocrinis sp. TaxID=2024383 RepID=UPI003C0D7D78